MKKSIVFLTIGFLAVSLAMPARGAEQSRQGIDTLKRPPIQVSPISVDKPDLVISMGGHGSVYYLGQRMEIAEYATNIEFTITNKGRVATGRAGSTFSVGVDYTPLCQAPDCNAPTSWGIGGALSAVGCAIVVRDATKSFHFLHPIIIDTPLAAGETRTVLATLVLPQCLIYSTLGGRASVYLIVDEVLSSLLCKFS